MKLFDLPQSIFIKFNECPAYCSANRLNLDVDFLYSNAELGGQSSAYWHGLCLLLDTSADKMFMKEKEDETP